MTYINHQTDQWNGELQTPPEPPGTHLECTINGRDVRITIWSNRIDIHGIANLDIIEQYVNKVVVGIS